jgi:uncharacterized membrane protein (UPF0127 family)
MRTAWLLREGEVLAAAEVAVHFSERTRGLLGRSSYEGAMLLPRTRSVHTAFMKFPIDVAFLDAELVVLDTVHLGKWRMARPRRRARSVVEAPGGAFERWGLRVGDRLEIREVQ